MARLGVVLGPELILAVMMYMRLSRLRIVRKRLKRCFLNRMPDLRPIRCDVTWNGGQIVRLGLRQIVSATCLGQRYVGLDVPKLAVSGSNELGRILSNKSPGRGRRARFQPRWPDSKRSLPLTFLQLNSLLLCWTPLSSTTDTHI